MPTQIVSAGNTAFITQNVTDTDDQVLSGGTLQINPGGTGSSTTVSGGGLERIGLPNSDAVAVDTTVLASGTEVILGGLSVSAVISGGAQFVYGGSAIGAVVISGTQFVEVASSINAGALHGSATGTVLSGGEQVVAGTAMDTVLSLGAIQDVESRGVASGTTVEGGFAEVFGLTVSSTYQAGTMDFVYSGGMADESMLNGGSEYVESGGTAVGTVIAAGGAQVVYGRTQFTSVTGGIQYVEAGAIVGLTEIEAAQILFGSASSSTVFSGGGEYIYSGGVASGTTISFGGAEFVEAGGTASRSTLGAAVQMVYGLAVSTVLDNGGAEYVEFGRHRGRHHGTDHHLRICRCGRDGQRGDDRRRHCRARGRSGGRRRTDPLRQPGRRHPAARRFTAFLGNRRRLRQARAPRSSGHRLHIDNIGGLCRG